MKQKFPLPETIVVPGDVEEDSVPVVQSSSQISSDASRRAIAWLKAGVYKRAIVTSEDIDILRQIDPTSWGIVIQVHPHKAAGLEVRWCNGQYTWSDGSDLRVVYSGCSAEDMRRQFAYNEQHQSS